MMAGRQPFFLRNGELGLQFKPTLPGWLFDTDGKLAFTFLGQVPVTYHNPDRRDLLPTQDVSLQRVILQLADQRRFEFAGGIIGEPYSQMVRAGQVAGIDAFFQA
jgi:hypothetical protein